MTVPEVKILDTKVLETYSNGNKVYENLSEVILPTKLKGEKIKVNSDDNY